MIAVLAVATASTGARAQDSAPAGGTASSTAVQGAPLKLPDPGTSVIASTPSDRDAFRGIPSLRLPSDDLFDGGYPGSGGNMFGGNARRGTTVVDRPRPDFDPLGVRVGGFTLFPAVTANVAYDGNVFGQPDGVDDVLGNLRVGALMRSNWARHLVSVDGFVNQRAYANYTSESGLTYRVGVQGRLDIDADTSVSAEVQRERVFLRRGSFTEVLSTRQPVRYNLTASSVGVRRDFGRFRASVVGYVGRFDFDDAQRFDGTPFSQRFRAYDLYRGSAQLGYATGAGPTVFVQGIVDLRRYRFPAPPIDRDSDSLEVLLGLSSDITPLLRGRAAIGYVQTSFKDPTIANRVAPSFDVDLAYLVTELTTVRLTGRRYFQNVSLASSPAVIVTDATLGADHELLRNLTISADVNYRHSDFTASSATASGVGAEARARLFINRRLRLDADIGYARSRRSGLTLGNFSELQGSVGVTFSL